MTTIVTKPKKLPQTLHIEKLEQIGSFIMEGLSEEESCILAGFPVDEFKEIKQSRADVSNFLLKKQIELKRKLLQQIQTKPSDKNAMWLLEALRPEEFGPKKKGGDTTINVVGAIIKDIRQNNETLPVKVHNGEYTEKNGGSDTERITVESVLK